MYDQSVMYHGVMRSYSLPSRTLLVLFPTFFLFTLRAVTPNMTILMTPVWHLPYGRSYVAFDPLGLGPSIGALMAAACPNTSGEGELMMASASRDGNSGLGMIQRVTLPRPDNLSWYAVQIQSRLGNVASATLRGKGYEEFLPLYRFRRRWSDRIKELELPLFPGYLFCRIDVSDRLLPILTTPGVIGIVGAGKTPVPVDDEEIEAIRAILRSGLAVQPWPFLRVGSKVYIEGGPLAGVEGIITNMDKVYRLIVSVNLLQRSVAVEIERAWARPILDRIGPRAVTLSARARPLAEAG